MTENKEKQRMHVLYTTRDSTMNHGNYTKEYTEVATSTTTIISQAVEDQDDENDDGDNADGVFRDDNPSSSSNSSASSSSRDDTTITVDDAIERLGTGKFQGIVLVAAGICFASDAMQVLLLSFLSEVLKIEWNLGPDETAMITSILFVGAIFGTLTLGPLADRKGRKPIFLLAASLISGFGVATAFSTNYWMLLCNLFMVGWGVGGLVVPFDILSEVLPADSRGKNLLVIEYFWTVGVLFVVAMAKVTLGDGSGGGEEDDGPARWREFVVICTIPCWFSVIIGYWWVPESPRWLCTQGRTTEAMDIIRQAARVNGLDVDFVFPPGLTIEDEEEEHSDFCVLFSPKWRWTTMKLWFAWGFFAFGYYGTIMVITEIFDSEEQRRLLQYQQDQQDVSEFDIMVADDGGGEHSTTPSYNFDYGAIFVSSSAELVGTTIAILSVDGAGRIPLQVISYAIAGVSVCALCLAASNHAHRKVLIGFGFAARIFEMTGSCVSWVSTAEILTTDVRTTGHSAANAVARIGSLFAPFLIEGNIDLVKKGLVMLAIHAGTVLCVSQLPETKGSHMGRAHVISEDDEDTGDETQILNSNNNNDTINTTNDEGIVTTASCQDPQSERLSSSSSSDAASSDVNEDSERFIT
mmetsp:Transcript_7793/g.19419  ORF Transcript_7793/g.19419 Transcript_7793/m.19419 type:complete len:637 (+) Transcript_7793:144-2054(+)